MTDEQIELEYMHMEYDRKQREGNGDTEYTDEQFDQWDEETEAEDRGQTRLDHNLIEDTEALEYTPDIEGYDPDEWEDVEIDD